MTRDDFWRLIKRIRPDGDGERRVAPLVAALAKRTPPDVRAFADHLTTCLRDVGSESHRDSAGENQSDDAFLYARLYVVSRGHEYFEYVRTRPALLPKTCD